MRTKSLLSTTIPSSHACRCTEAGTRCCGHIEKTLRWGALSAGSVVGIAAWTLFFVIGAVVTSLFSAGDTLGWGRAIYGSVSASLALALGSGVASFSQGKTPILLGAVYGAVMWGMAAITLFMVTCGLSVGWWQNCPEPLRSVVQIGAAAVGMSNLESHEAQTLLAPMAGVLLLSLGAAFVGGCRGANHSLR